MKEKLIIGTAIVTLIGLIYIDASLNTTESGNISQAPQPIPQVVEEVNEVVIPDYTEELTIPVDKVSMMNSCGMSEMGTNQLSFSEAFGYFRNCLGADSSFQWQGNIYTTLLESEVVIPLADTQNVEEEGQSTEITIIR